MSKLKVLVLFGGIAEERSVSNKSAAEVARNLNLAKYEPVYVGITARGEWRLCEMPGPDWEAGAGARASLSPDRGVRGLLVEDAGGVRTLPIDVVLPVLHGRFGEDGCVQGLLELAGIPYAGCDVQSSVLAMDKSLAYLIVREAGIAPPSFHRITDDADLAAARLTYPVFVKPARSGSSFGVSRVERAEGLPAAVAAARRFDSAVLVEEAVHGDEVGCAVLEGDAGLITGEVDQIRLSHGFFRIHQESAPETGSENSSVVVPAAISDQAREAVRQTARTIYRALGCRGLARVDLFLTATGQLVLNEVNTFPGLTAYSRYPRMMAAAGMPLAEVVDRLIAFALAERRP